MPGQPFERAVERVIEQDHGGVDALYLRLAAGENLSAIARTIMVTDPKTGVPRAPDRATVRRILNNTDERRAQYADARKESAEADVDTAREKLESAPDTREGIAKAREVASHLRWQASKTDRATFGDQPSTAIQINSAGSLFLSAVMKPNALPPPKAPTPPAVDAEVVEELPALKPAPDAQRQARVHALIDEIMKHGHPREQAVRLAIHLERAERPAISEQVPGLRPRLIKEEEDGPDD